MKLTRRQFAAAFAAAATNPSSLYRLIDRVTGQARSKGSEGAAAGGTAHATAQRCPRRRGRGDRSASASSSHHRSGSGRRAISGDARGSGRAGRRLTALENTYPASAAGLAVTVAWGLPYFHRFVPGQARRAIPIDLRATAVRRRQVRVLEDAERFPSDPARTILEKNDIAVLLRSDNLDAIDEGQRRLFDDLHGLFTVTSIRCGFVGGGFRGKTSLPKQMAIAARIHGAGLHPRHGTALPRLHLDCQAGARPAQDRQLRNTRVRQAHGRLLRRRHPYAPVAPFRERQRLVPQFRPRGASSTRCSGPDSLSNRAAQTIRQAASDVETSAQLQADYRRDRRVGHAEAIQSASRLHRDIIGPDGTVYRKGTAVPQRADFNTLDNPFAWSAHPNRDRLARTHAAGIHFVVFNPTADDFRRVRLAMDDILPNGVQLDFAPRSIGQGIYSVFHATHRQNFLVPPRAHRSFPLSERRA